MLPVVHVHRWARLQNVSHRCRRKAQQKSSEGIRSCASVCHRSARVATIQGESIYGGISHDVTTHSEVVFAQNPGQRISERNQVLIQRAESIASAIREVRKGPASVEKDSRMAKSGKRERAHH